MMNNGVAVIERVWATDGDGARRLVVLGAEDLSEGQVVIVHHRKLADLLRDDLIDAYTVEQWDGTKLSLVGDEHRALDSAITDARECAARG